MLPVFCIMHFIVLYQLQQALDSLFLGDVLLNTLLAAVERNLSTCSTHIAIIGIGHFAGAVNNTAHDTNLQALEVSCSSLYARQGSLQVIHCTATTGTGNILGLAYARTGSLQNTEHYGIEFIGTA